MCDRCYLEVVAIIVFIIVFLLSLSLLLLLLLLPDTAQRYFLTHYKEYSFVGCPNRTQIPFPCNEDDNEDEEIICLGRVQFCDGTNDCSNGRDETLAECFSPGECVECETFFISSLFYILFNIRCQLRRWRR